MSPSKPQRLPLIKPPRLRPGDLIGIIYGYAGLVDGIVNRMRNESGEEPMVIATGGLAPIISEVSETIAHVEEFLTLQGLIILFKRNQ